MKRFLSVLIASLLIVMLLVITADAARRGQYQQSDTDRLTGENVIVPGFIASAHEGGAFVAYLTNASIAAGLSWNSSITPNAAASASILHAVRVWTSGNSTVSLVEVGNCSLPTASTRTHNATWINPARTASNTCGAVLSYGLDCNCTGGDATVATARRIDGAEQGPLEFSLPVVLNPSDEYLLIITNDDSAAQDAWCEVILLEQ